MKIHIYNNMSLNSSYNDRCFRQKLFRRPKHILCSVTAFRKWCPLWDNVENYDTAVHATDENIIRRMRFAGCITKTTFLVATLSPTATLTRRLYASSSSYVFFTSLFQFCVVRLPRNPQHGGLLLVDFPWLILVSFLVVITIYSLLPSYSLVVSLVVRPVLLVI
jgi:hypothetical protein